MWNKYTSNFQECKQINVYEDNVLQKKSSL